MLDVKVDSVNAQLLRLDQLQSDITKGSTIKIGLTEYNNPIMVDPEVGIQVTTFDNLMSAVD